MNSRLYRGQVRHRRFGERAYRFAYGVYYFCLDLAELDAVDRQLALVSRNRANVLSFHDRDHVCHEPGGVPGAIRERVRAAGTDAGARIELLTNLRVLGYVFNPVSFYLIRDAAGVLRHVVAEVHNTHGQRHLYDLAARAASANGVYRSAAGKQFYVSPFIDMDGRYEFELREQGGRLYIRIDEYREGTMFFQADLTLRSLPLTNANVMRMLARYPLVTLKTTVLIHWQGLKLWLRGERYRRNPSPEESKA